MIPTTPPMIKHNMLSSNIPSNPVCIAAMDSNTVKEPKIHPISIEQHNAIQRITITLPPNTARINTSKYGNILIRSIQEKLVDTKVSTSTGYNKYIPKVRIAGTRTIRRFTRNFSRIEIPWVLVAAIVVSEIKDRLSPNMAPPTIAANNTGNAARSEEHTSELQSRG